MRLLPSREAGLLVLSLKGFVQYQLYDAWVWEHQALVRARVVAGAPALAERFNEVRAVVLCQVRDRNALAEEVLAMREKMREHLGSRDDTGPFDLKQDSDRKSDV